MTANPAWGAFPLAVALIGLFLARGRPPPRLMLDAILIGVTLGAAAAFAEAPFELRTNPYRFSAATLAFLFAGLPEEGLKMLGAAAFLRSHYLTRDRLDATLAAGALALGFAGLENLFYLAGAGSGFATLAYERALTATPFHVFLGLAGGAVVAAARGPSGVVRVVAVWLALASIHGVYDFAVFATAANAEPYSLIARAAAALGLAPAVALRGLLAAAELGAALCAAAALALAKSAPRPPPQGRLARAATSRATGALVGAALVAAAVPALAVAAATAYARDSAAPLVAIAALGLSPLALGALFLLFPLNASPPSAGLRRIAFRLSGAAALLVAIGAVVWGPAQARRLQSMRFEAAAARSAASGDYEAAIEDCDRAIALAPDDIGPLALRASAEGAAARYAAARADLDAALRLAPGSAAVYAQRAELDRRADDPAAAVADYGEALARKPDDPDLLALRGDARLEAGDAEGARLDIAAARRLAPNAAAVLRAAAAWETDAGDLDAAIADLNARLHADPADASSAFQRGRLWLYKGDAARARADFARADRGDGSLYPALWAYLARRAAGEDGTAELALRLDAAPSAWPAPIARDWLGRAAEPFAAAASPGERCEATFYAAAEHFAAGEPDAAEPGLRAALATCPAAFIEREGAKAMLRRLAR